MKRIAQFLLLVALLTGAAGLLSAQVVVTKGAGAKTGLDWSTYRADADDVSRTFFQVLQADLLRSGWFGRAAGPQAELTLSGNVTVDGQVRAECRVVGRATQRSYLSKAYKAEPALVRQLAHQAADEIVYAVTGRRGIASGRLALVGTRSGKKEIYLCDADGGSLRQLTRDNSVSLAPNWSPDGRQLTYTAYLKSFPDVYLVDTQSGNRRPFANYPGLNTGGAFSPSGREVALILSRDGNPELYLKSLSGGSLTRLSNTKRYAEASPCWSPDGNEICYVSDQVGSPQLFIVNRSGGAPRRLTSRGSQNVAPDWGPGGLIAYSSLIGGHFQVCVTDASGAQVKQLTSDGADYEDPCWAPDGRHIVCGRAVNYRSQVYLLDTLGDPPVALTDSKGDWYSPAWAPSR